MMVDYKKKRFRFASDNFERKNITGKLSEELQEHYVVPSDYMVTIEISEKKYKDHVMYTDYTLLHIENI